MERRRARRGAGPGRLVAALERWPVDGVPDNPGAWLMATAKRRAIDKLRRDQMLIRKHSELARELEDEQERVTDLDAALDDHVGDDLLGLMFTACHPVLSTEARVALTLRMLGGLKTDEIARAFLRIRADHRPTHRARQAYLRGGRRAFRGSARRPTCRPPAVGAGGDLPDLQRGLHGDRR